MNQKGGVTKTTICVDLAAGLAQAGKKVLVVDCDPQASLTISLGNSQPNHLPVTLFDMMGKSLNNKPIAFCTIWKALTSYLRIFSLPA